MSNSPLMCWRVLSSSAELSKEYLGVLVLQEVHVVLPQSALSVACLIMTHGMHTSGGLFQLSLIDQPSSFAARTIHVCPCMLYINTVT